MNVKAHVPGSDDHTIVAEAERGEHAASTVVMLTPLAAILANCKISPTGEDFAFM